MRAIWVGLWVAAVGCGGDGGGADGPPLDAGPTARFELRRTSVAGTIATTPYQFTGDDVAPVFLTTDGAATTEVSPGVWEAATTGTPAVRFTLNQLPRIWTVPSATVRGELVAFGHPDPEPAPGGASLALAITLPEPFDPAAPQRFLLHAVGADYAHELTSGELPAQGGTSLTGTIAYSGTRITPADGVVLLRLATPSLAITGAAAIAPFDQAAGSTAVNGTLTAVASDRQLDLALDRAALASGFTALSPPMTNNFQGFWNLSLAPGANAGVSAGVTVAGGALPQDGSPVSIAFGNPFEARGWPAVVEARANASRQTAPIMGQAKTLIASVSVLALASAPPTTIAAVLPDGFALNGQPLTTDLLNAPAGSLELTFTDATACNLYTMILFNTVGMAGAETAVLEMTSTEPRFAIPDNAFLGPMRPPWYFARVTCTAGGYAGAASGDLQTLTLPMSTATVDSPVFTKV